MLEEAIKFLADLLQHCAREAANTLNVWYSKDRADGNTSDERRRRLPLLFLHKRCTDVLPFAATTQGVIFVFQGQWNRFFGQEFTIRTMFPRATPFRQSWQESFPGCNLVTPKFHVKQIPDDRHQRSFYLSQAIMVER